MIRFYALWFPPEEICMLFKNLPLTCGHLKACQIPYRKGNKVILLKVNHFSKFSQAHLCSY